MLTTKLAPTLAVIAALTITPPMAVAAPSRGSKKGPNSVLESTSVKCTMFLPDGGDSTKNEISIETLESAAAYWLPEVNDEVL